MRINFFAHALPDTKVALARRGVLNET